MLPIKGFVILAGIVVSLLFTMGAVAYEKRGYGCYPEGVDRYRWGEKTKMFNLGSFNFYATPLIKDCPSDNRYDPATALDCGAYCTLKELGQD